MRPVCVYCSAEMKLCSQDRLCLPVRIFAHILATLSMSSAHCLEVGYEHIQSGVGALNMPFKRCSCTQLWLS
jgi:hypothetical protein